MTMTRALQIILTISVFGVLFSGFLTLREFGAPAEATGSCSALGAPGTILGYPPCVYGLVMYLLIAGLAIAGLRSRR
jgi:hypothetical protein